MYMRQSKCTSFNRCGVLDHYIFQWHQICNALMQHRPEVVKRGNDFIICTSTTHHFSTELLSTFNSVLIPYLNTDSPFVHGFLSFTLQSSSNSLHHMATINMSSRRPQVCIQLSLGL